MRKTILSLFLACASMVIMNAQTGKSMLSDVYVVDQYGGYVICYGSDEEPVPVKPGDKIDPNSKLMLTDGATVKLYHEHMGKAKLFTVNDESPTNADGLVEVSDVISGEGEVYNLGGQSAEGVDETEAKGYIRKYWQKVGQAVASAETSAAGVYGWASGPEKSGTTDPGPIKGYGKRFSDATTTVNQMTLSGEIPYEDVCFSWKTMTIEASCFKIADLMGVEIFSASVKGNDMCVDLRNLAMDTDKTYTWSVTGCQSGKIISDPVKFKVLDAEAREATLADIKGFAAIKGFASGADGGSSCESLKTLLMEASALADRGLKYDANQTFQEVLNRIGEAKELEYIANALYTDFVKSLNNADGGK